MTRNGDPVPHGLEKMEQNQLMTAERLEEIERQACEEGLSRGHDEGFARGHAEGLEAGERAIRDRVAQLERLFDAMAQPLADLDERVEGELVTLALTVAKQLLRRELKSDPGQVVAVVREAIGALPSAEGRIHVHLHPEDAGLVREALHLDDMERPWRIVEEPSMSRGGVRIVTPTSRIDASLEARLNAVIASVWGGEREGDTSRPEAGAP